MRKKLLVIIFGVFVSFFTPLKGQDVKKQQKLKLSFSERIRFTTIDNSITLDKDKDILTFSRWRTYLGLNYAPTKNLSSFIQFGNESRVWFSPASKRTKFDEIYIDQLYVLWKNIGNLPLDIKLGRQNIMLDEGFVCLDGQPLTGSRSAYFNAIRTDFHINKKQTLTAFFSYNPKTDDILPIVNEVDPSQMLEEQTNRGTGLYYQLKDDGFLSKLSLYYFHKNTVANEKNSVELKRNVFGGRVDIPIATSWKCVAEGAYQLGKTGEDKHNAYGGYLRIERKIDEIPIIKKLSLGGFYLSGDDPKTKKSEGWDPLWSRWPKWSESYIYTQIIENKGKVANWSNISSIHLGLKGALSPKVSFDITNYYLWALENNMTDFCSGKGKNRGNLFIGRLNYKIDKRWAGHLLWEKFNPGNFYFSSAQGYNWVRFELTYKF